MKLKIRPEHYEFIKNKFKEMYAHLEPPSFTHWRRVYKDAGLSEKRFVWDLFWALDLSKFTCDVLYKYMNDDHLYSALRRIVKELESELG